MPCELHPKINVIVYVLFFRLNETNFDNCSQLEPKNIMLKSKTQIVVQKTKIELQKIVRCDQKLRFPNEIPSTFRVIWCFVKYLVFRSKSQFSREIQDIYIVNPNFLFGKSGISTFVAIACHTYSGHFILPYNIRNHPTCLKGLGIYMQSIYSWHKNGMFF
jgi:hypothetical protein